MIFYQVIYEKPNDCTIYGDKLYKTIELAKTEGELRKELICGPGYRVGVVVLTTFMDKEETSNYNKLKSADSKS